MAKRVLGAPLWLWGLLGAAVALALTQKDTIMVYGRKALEAAMRDFFILSLPSYARDYGDVILIVAREESVDPFVIFALGDRESGWGRYLDSSWKGDNGHGYGLMQIDDRSNGVWLSQNNWADPYTNVKKGVQIFKAKLAFLAGKASVPGLTTGSTVYVGAKAAAARGVQPGSYADPRPLEGDDLIRGAVAAYNTGEGNVLTSLAVGVPVDRTTAGGDYSSDVIQRMLGAVASFDKTAPA